MKANDRTHQQLVRLRENLTARISDEELRTLCFDMAVDYESLPSQGKAGKVRELIAEVERTGHTSELVERCYHLFPEVSWEDVFKSAQVFELPKAKSDTNEPLQANALAQALCQDEWLLEHISQIVRDYHSAKSKRFKPFNLRAEDVFYECQQVLQGMSQGYMVVHFESEFSTTGAHLYRRAKKSLRAVAIDIIDWRSDRGRKIFEEDIEARKRGVEVTRIFVQPKGTLWEILDILKEQQRAGFNVYIAHYEDTPSHLCYDYLLIDESILVRAVQKQDERISIERKEVQRMAIRFEALKALASPLTEELIERLELKQREQTMQATAA